MFEGEVTAGANCPALAVAGLTEPIPLPSGTELPAGAAAALVVRPEQLVLSHTPPIGFAIAATVSSIGYLGGGSIVHLATEQRNALKAFLPGPAANSFGRGKRVWATWPHDEGVVLTK